MADENENILNILKTILENKDRQITNLKLQVNEHVKDLGDGSPNAKINTSIRTVTSCSNAFKQYPSCDVECQCNCHKLLKSDNCSQTFETDFHETDFTDSALDWAPDVGADVTVADIIKEVVNDNAPSQNDYVYDETSKMYYSPSTGYYYDWERRLLYDPYTRIYYNYNDSKNSYEFYYQLDLQPDEVSRDSAEQVSQKVSGLKLDDAPPTYNNESADIQKYRDPKRKKKNKKKNDKCIKNNGFCNKKKVVALNNELFELDSCSSLEDGEIQSSSSTYADSSFEDDVIFESPFIESPFVPDLNEDSLDGYPPCIRAIIRQSSSQKVGTLFLIPCTGGIIGREKSNSIYVPDISISRVHAKISFDNDSWTYNVTDLGSQNGTFINGIRVTQDAGQNCQSLKHNDVLGLGSCKMLIHIHRGNSTCNECEPGLVQSDVVPSQDKSSVIKSKEEKEKERRQNLKQIKKKFGLDSVNYGDGENSFSSKSQNYQDRAETRRKVIGSQNPYEKDTPPSSLDTSVPSSNKGYQMLKKMGWQDGDSIGANEAGILIPIDIQFRNTRAGLGSDVIEQVSIPEDPRRRKWKKAQKRFQDLYKEPDDDPVY